jgi:hypothetical protein
MRSISCVLLICSVAHGQSVYVVTSKGVWKTDIVAGVPSWATVIEFKSTDTVIGGVGSPTPAPPDGGGTIAERTRSRVALVGEPQVARAIGANFRQFGASLAGGAGSWENALAGIRRFNDFILSGASKRSQWEAVLTQTFAELEREPKNGQTLIAVGTAFEAGAGQIIEDGEPEQVNWAKMLTCLPCIIDAFMSSRSARLEPVPDPIVQQIKEHRTKVLGMTK